MKSSKKGRLLLFLPVDPSSHYYLKTKLSVAGVSLKPAPALNSQ
jgi:hypothetical protein